MVARVGRRSLWFEHLHQPDGWLSPGHVSVGDDGVVEAVAATPPPGWDAGGAERFAGYALPGMPNLHSHAFQRAIAGFTEARAREGGADSFWTWREAMYGCALRVTPEQCEAIAAQAFAEMLEAGYTAVGEFHYLHHDLDGRPYADPAELSLRILAAAAQTGIAITHLPVFYAHGGFDRPPGERQRRFVHSEVDAFLRLFDAVQRSTARLRHARAGIAPHSLRAVAPAELDELAAFARSSGVPLHLHIAEQRAEVEECLARRGARPLQWLADRLELGPELCLVHATHCDDDERNRLAASAAVVGLCPTTEANLGDGRFPVAELVAAGGRFGIGSDSQVEISVAAELRHCEYGERVVREQRNVLASGDGSHTGRRVFELALAGGAQALAQPMGAVSPGRRADVVVLDADHPRLWGHGPDTALDAFVFAGADRAVRDVLVGGRRVVRDGRHVDAGRIAAGAARAVRALSGGAS
jgi:formimidoylglutamate deiminase